MRILRRLRHLLRHLQWAWMFDCPICYTQIVLAFDWLGGEYNREFQRYDRMVRALSKSPPAIVTCRAIRIPMRIA